MTNRRKNYFIKPEFQANFFIKFVGLLLLEAVVIAALFMVISQGTLTAAYRGAELTIEKTGVYFFVNFLMITTIAGIGIAVAGLVVFVYLTHRLGGPLYRFEKSLREAKEGNIRQRIDLRKTDELTEMRDLLNDFLVDLDEKVSGLKDDVDGAIELMDPIKDSEGKGNCGKVKELLLDAKSRLKHFKTSK